MEWGRWYICEEDFQEVEKVQRPGDRRRNCGSVEELTINSE
jgi:hypothetical protein